ncbi:putative chitin biosynthesis protein (Chs5) [Aspergillus clavatus NRRL 1]|uniref:Chitin biosynthesis protein (Chs5), putative n=1 Tax=Aspergillus clavatus (strain ATCC 1007 / CBS 513.65 / DSM 816 / NCTC 3887 / NRRL 1 / QM 1276 / 107) TaxID=344612 RepID=A1CMR8_ASPCL|nr:chitin biosynthesis protein (Chs5), putative [Aspergillus clavatus NRRL 1]EAW08855.1 chitin biosynthesis protein (Chs5), putative [Aspergillus clavatus NRRL 1]
MLVSLTVGKVDAGVAVLLTQDNRLIEFPSVLLPNNIASGSIVDITVSRNHTAEAASTAAFQALQKRILNTYGVKNPAPPILRLRNATQTSLVLEWDPIDLATASLKSLSLYRNGSKAGSIPRPLETRSTKISGLAIDMEYTFHLVLRTTAGTYQSEKLTCRTHKMTDLSGITVTPGVLPPQQKDALAAALDRIGGKLIDTVRIDTTHFVCTEGKGPLWEKAVEMNIPVVVPEWVDACEAEGTLVSVRGYYLNADPKARQLGPIHASSHQHTRSSVSMATNAPPKSHPQSHSQPQSQSPSQSQSQSQSQSRLSLHPQPVHERNLSVGEPPVTPFPGASMSGQPRADEEEVSSDEETPPPPPPKDEGIAEAEPTVNGKSASPGPAEEGNTSEDDKAEEESESEQENSDKEQEHEEAPSNDNDAKTKGKEGEGDFSEVTL